MKLFRKTIKTIVLAITLAAALPAPPPYGIEDGGRDPLYSSQWAITATESDRAWRKVKQKKQIKVAIVDSGVDYNHPDLKNRVLIELGHDFFNGDSDPMDDYWHGTHIAGIISAESGNGIGISGIVGELDVKIIPVKVLGEDGRGSSGIIAQGIRYAVDKGADIVNLSITFSAREPVIADALKYAWDKGVLVIAASGNNNEDCDTYSPTADFGAYTVAAVDELFEKAHFSSYGASVKVAAPGVNIMSTIPGGQYQYREGTSMAAPVVTGIAAMLLAERPELTPEQLSQILTESSLSIIKDGISAQIGQGVVNGTAAIKRVLEM